jgi:zinc protease
MPFRSLSGAESAVWPLRSLALLLPLVVTLAAGCVTAPNHVPPPSRPSRYALANGVRVIVQEHRASDAVALHLWVGVGGRDEGPTERGFSHFVEHMLFKGTDTLPTGFVDREVESVGGRTNAGTSWDYTFYYMLLPAARAVRGIEVLADVAVNSIFDPVEMQREREVIFEEIRLGEDDPGTFLARRLYELAFRGHPYGFRVLGDPDALNGATRENLRGYYRRHYVSSNLTVVVVGAVDPAEIRSAVERTFGRLPARPYSRQPLPAPPVIDAAFQQTVERPEGQASLGLAWSGPPLGHPGMFAADLLAHILGGSRSSRLTQALRERDGIVSSVRAEYGSLQGGGLFTVTARCEPSALPQVEAAIGQEVRRIRDNGVSERERERALTAAEAEHAFATETAEGRAHAYGQADTLWTLDGELGYLARLRAVTREDIQDAARRYLSVTPARLLLVPRGAQP